MKVLGFDNYNHIKSIISRDEFLSLLFLMKKEDRKNYNVISISEPVIVDKTNYKHIDLKHFDNFNSVLQLDFIDKRKEIDNDDVSEFEISKEILYNIKDFIIENKSKKFIIHCSTGVSRSSSIGLMVEKLLTKNLDIDNNKITKHYRYSPNPLIIKMIKEFI